MTGENLTQVTDGAARFVSVAKAAELLQKSEHCIRQLMQRGKLTRGTGPRTTVDLNSVLTYYARKKGLPSWEENFNDIKGNSFVGIEFASQTLLVQPGYIIKLIKDKFLKGYITATGDIMITRDSINAYLRKPDAPAVRTKDL